MARACAAVVLFAVVFCLLVAPAPARRPVELPLQVVPDAVDREAAAEPLLPKPVADAAEADPSAALAIPEEEEVASARQHSSLLCLIFRCDGDAVALSSSEEPPSLDGWAQPAGKAKVEDDEVGEDGQERPCDSDSDSDWDSDSDGEEDEGGIVGWFWRLARRFS